MPITWPLLFKRAPPELPGLTAASVWISLLLIVFPESSFRVTSLSLAEMTPVVTDWP